MAQSSEPPTAFPDPHSVVYATHTLENLWYLFGCLFNWALYGVLSVQIYVYCYNFPKDRRSVKFLVRSSALLGSSVMSRCTLSSLLCFRIGDRSNCANWGRYLLLFPFHSHRRSHHDWNYFTCRARIPLLSDLGINEQTVVVVDLLDYRCHNCRDVAGHLIVHG
ncbi:hypothetical protein BJY52DRAFT_1275746 [Lactarius psammicola]|nr:hypothetical protein BJY52DRAFT_1275746 [Lactarius psammicola]